MNNCQCQHLNSRCVDSRMREGYRRRRYKCDACGQKFSTVEVRVDDLGPRTNRYANALDALIDDLSTVTRRQKDAIHDLVNSFKEASDDE